MRIIILAMLTFALVYYMLYLPLKTKTKPNGLMLFLILIISIPTAIMEYRWSIPEQEASIVVAEISGNPDGYLKCQRISATFFDATQNLGEVKFDKSNEAYLKYSGCVALFQYMRSDKSNPTPKQISAVHVLSHEAGHVGGDYNEASTECVAMQNDSRTAQLLGATKEQADKLAQNYYTETYPWMRTNYQSPDCAQSGLMDKTPEDGIFP
jgi:hypothetical protein